MLGNLIGIVTGIVMNYALRLFVHWLVSLTKPPMPSVPTFKMEIVSMSQFRIRYNILPATPEELDPKFRLVDRRFDYAVNDGDVTDVTVSLSGGEVVVEPLNPGDTVAVQLFNRDETGRESEPAELLVEVPTVVDPPVLPVPAVPTFTIEEIPGT